MGSGIAALADILDALADVIRDTIGDIGDWDVQVEPWFVLNPSPITVDVFPADPPTEEEDAGFGEREGPRLFSVRARTNTPDSSAGRDVLTSLMDIENEHSVLMALESDQTLAGLATQVTVVQQTGLSAFPNLDGSGFFLGTQWTVLVMDIPYATPTVPIEEEFFLLQGDGVSRFTLGDGSGFLLQGDG